MSSTPQFAHTDTKKPDGFYVQFERVLVRDENASAPDKMCDGYWPSRDPDNAGYVGRDNLARFDSIMRAAKARMTRWKSDHWHYVGVRARAKCLIVRNGVGTYINLESPGIWGIESDSGEPYLDESYRDEIDELKDMIAAMHDPVFEE